MKEKIPKIFQLPTLQNVIFKNLFSKCPFRKDVDAYIGMDASQVTTKKNQTRKKYLEHLFGKCMPRPKPP